MAELVEISNDHGWGYAIRDGNSLNIRLVLNSHADEKTEELRKSTLKIAEDEKWLYENPDRKIQDRRSG